MQILVVARSEKQAQYFLRDMQKEYILDWYNPDYNAAMGQQSVLLSASAMPTSWVLMRTVWRTSLKMMRIS